MNEFAPQKALNIWIDGVFIVCITLEDIFMVGSLSLFPLFYKKKLSSSVDNAFHT